MWEKLNICSSCVCHVVDPESPALEYSWQLVGMLQYSQEKKEYLVHKADCNGWVRDPDGKPILTVEQREGMFSGYWLTLVILNTT